MTRLFVFELYFPGKDFRFPLVYHVIDIVQSVTYCVLRYGDTKPVMMTLH